ncbi:MAG: polymer-forming cytoskeletal protein [Gammaproteobacteria bacterium]|nr:polymer-forming cytoskeletal protein [Gammaproteobacteria bacterium]
MTDSCRAGCANPADLEYSSIYGDTLEVHLPPEFHELGGYAMFKRGQDNYGSAVTSPPRIGEKQPIRSKNVSVIGPTLVFRGELSADEDLVIEGTIEGTIAHHKKNLTIGKQGRVTADIHASSVIVEGELNGDIHSDGLVSLAKGGKVRGNIYCARLVMQEGTQFNGTIDMAIPNPLKVAPGPEEAEEEFAQAENLTA